MARQLQQRVESRISLTSLHETFARMLTYDERALIRALADLPDSARVAFACACASRLVRSYRSALEEVEAGSPDLISPALDTLWAYVGGGPKRDWVALAEELIAAIPDEDEITTPAHRVLDDALAATAYAARTAATKDAQEAAYAARRLYEAVDAFAQQGLNFSVYTKDVEGKLAQHQFVEREVRRQLRDLADLQAALSTEVLKTRSYEERALS